uniref:Uncharacterized protein n=1 Tax=Octopus bimaculoides TaxID=37653 RepID=A0A0L8FQL5_OCTBM
MHALNNSLVCFFTFDNNIITALMQCLKNKHSCSKHDSSQYCSSIASFSLSCISKN